MADLNPTNPTTNTETQASSAAAKHKEASHVAERLHRHYDRNYLLQILASTAVESLALSTDTDTARAALTGMIDMLRSDFDEISSMINQLDDLAEATTTPAGIEA